MSETMSETNNATTVQLNIDEIRQLTNESKTDLDTLYDEACKDAFKHIVVGSADKIQNAAKNGRTRAYLFRWQYTSDPSDKTYSFQNVRISDILRKGSLLSDLRKHFNPGNDPNGFKVGYHRFNTRDNEPRQYGLYVSWYVPKKRPEGEDNVEANAVDEE